MNKIAKNNTAAFKRRQIFLEKNAKFIADLKLIQQQIEQINNNLYIKRAIQVFYWKVCYYWSVSNKIHPVDNSVRDIFRNYERSYYMWILKYVYIPLGGKYSKFINILVIVQLFIMFNEMDSYIFYWGLTMSALFIIEEIIYVKFNNHILINQFIIYLQMNYIVKAFISGIEICFILFISILAFVPHNAYLSHFKYTLKKNKSSMTAVTLIMVIVAIFLIQLYFRCVEKDIILQKESQLKRDTLNNSINASSQQKSSNIIEISPNTNAK